MENKEILPDGYYAFEIYYMARHIQELGDYFTPMDAFYKKMKESEMGYTKAEMHVFASAVLEQLIGIGQFWKKSTAEVLTIYYGARSFLDAGKTRFKYDGIEYPASLIVEVIEDHFRIKEALSHD